MVTLKVYILNLLAFHFISFYHHTVFSEIENGKLSIKRIKLKIAYINLVFAAEFIIFVGFHASHTHFNSKL